MYLCMNACWPEEGIGFAVAEVAGGYEPCMMILGTELGTFEETEVLLTAKPLTFFKKHGYIKN